MKASVWTTRRKVLGNLIPAMVWTFPSAVGLLIMISKGQILGPGLWLLAVATVLAWLALNTFGFFENMPMQRALELQLRARKELPSPEAVFVGFATPKYQGLLDAHEDVGFLDILPDRLIFISETRKVEFLLSEFRSIRYRFNVHSLVLLGRWISVEGESGGKPIRLLLEPRQRATMLGNFRASSALRNRLAKWGSSRKLVS